MIMNEPQIYAFSISHAVSTFDVIPPFRHPTSLRIFIPIPSGCQFTCKLVEGVLSLGRGYIGRKVSVHACFEQMRHIERELLKLTKSGTSSMQI